MDKFYSLLFRPGEKTCFSKNIFGTMVYNVTDWELFGAEYFSINPLVERRRDENVTAYRNILVEFDTLPLRDQAKQVMDIQMPFSTCVYSGGKSLHFILSLDNDLSKSDFVALKSRVYRAIDGIDPACGNPSRFSRCPGAWRKDKGTIQKLIHVGSAVPRDRLEKWLLSRGVKELPPVTPFPKVETNSSQWFTDVFLYWKTKDFLDNGATEGERHSRLVLAAYDFCRCGKPIEEALERLSESSGLPFGEVRNTVRHCYRGQ